MLIIFGSTTAFVSHFFSELQKCFLDHIKYSMYRNCFWRAKENAATLTSVVQILTIINKYSSSPHEAMKARRIPYCFIKIQLVDQKNMGKMQFTKHCFSLLVGCNAWPRSCSTNQNAALIIDHQLDFTNKKIIIILQEL